MRPTILRALVLSAALLAPASALAQSGPEQPNNGPPMMWDGPGMMWGDGDGSWGPGMMGRGGGYSMMRGCPMMGGGMMGGGMMRGPMMGGADFQRSASAWLDGQLAYAHTELAITEAQEPAWKAYVESVHDRSAGMLETHQAMWSARREQGVPFNEAYDLHITLMESRLEALKASRDSSLKLFDALNPDQQKKASWVLPQSMCMM